MKHGALAGRGRLGAGERAIKRDSLRQAKLNQPSPPPALRRRIRCQAPTSPRREIQCSGSRQWGTFSNPLDGTHILINVRFTTANQKCMEYSTRNFWGKFIKTHSVSAICCKGGEISCKKPRITLPVPAPLSISLLHFVSIIRTAPSFLPDMTPSTNVSPLACSMEETLPPARAHLEKSLPLSNSISSPVVRYTNTRAGEMQGGFAD